MMAWEIYVHTYNCGEISACKCETQEEATAKRIEFFRDGFQIGTFENSVLTFYPPQEIKLIEIKKE